LCLKSNSVSGTFNIASGTSISMIELAKLIAGFFKVGIDYKNDEMKWKKIGIFPFIKQQNLLDTSPVSLLQKR